MKSSLIAPLLLAACITSAAAQPAQEDFTAFIAQAKATLTADFKDPAAVQYRGLFVSRDKAMPVLCGEVNGKNSYGAYVGFRRFFATTLADLSMVLDPKDSFVYDRMEPKMCSNKIADVQ